MPCASIAFFRKLNLRQPCGRTPVSHSFNSANQLAVTFRSTRSASPTTTTTTTMRAAAGSDPAADWAANLVTSDEEAARLAQSFKTVAVLGIKTERQADQPAFYVAEYLAGAGVQVIPVPVYYPDVQQILGRQVHRTVEEAAAAAGGPLDCVDVFRRPSDVAGHVADVIAAAPRVVWLQSGIRCPEAEEAWARAGIRVVADKCLMVLHRRAAKL